MTSIIRVEKKTVTTKQNATKDILCVYLNGKATTKQKEFFKKFNFRYYSARYNLKQHDNGQFYREYTSQGCYYTDYRADLYNALTVKAINQPAPQIEQPAKQAVADKPKAVKQTSKQKVYAKLYDLYTEKEMMALVASRAK